MANNRIVKIAQNRIYITPNYYFILEETNLPSTNFSFKGTADFFWEIEITAFNKEAKELTAKVIDYEPKDIISFYEQQSKSHFDRLLFKSFDWPKLEPFLSLYRKSDLKYLIEN